MGRNANNDLCVASDDSISGEHACLRYQSGGLFLYDQGSRNGTFLNEQRVSGTPVMVRPGDRIRLGESAFEVMATGAGGSPRGAKEEASKGPERAGLLENGKPGTAVKRFSTSRRRSSLTQARGMDSNDERLEVGALSETGYTREENQDRMSGARVPLGHLYIVADGMGGHKGGALAAQMAVEELQRYIGQAAAGESADAVIEGAFKAANDAVYKRSNSGDTAVAGMGTTAVLALILGRGAKLAHVGDSRAYLFRNHRLAQLTTDHTIVQRMIEAGMLRPDEAADHPQSSVLERAIGSAPSVGVDIRDHHLEEGDALLLCSDGLSGYVGADK